MDHLQPIDSRLRPIIAALCIAFLLIVIRLFYLQIISHTYYASRSEQNFLRVESIPSERGTIYDCNGNLLATNRPVTNLSWQGTGNRTLNAEQKELLLKLEFLTQSPLSAPAQHAITLAERQFKQTPIAFDISLEQLSNITEQYPNNKNLAINTHFQRHYPYGTYASHVVGYLNRNVEAGQMGLEKICNELLKGHDGSRIKTINSIGRTITTTGQELSRAGTDIVTTIDINLQRIAEKIYPNEHSGCILIIDPENGAIRALVSRPTFDPSLFLKPISHDVWSELQHKKPFLNRAINPYPPGSIFKLVTISAALENGLLHPDQIWDCKGFVEFAGRNYWCNRKWGHGKLTTPQAFAHSCNVLFFELGKLIDIDLLAEYAQRFGLGQSTDFLFINNSGIVPTRDWKMLTKGERWWPGETLSVAIGQSFLLSTPLQIARMIGAIFTGYLAKPRILESETIEQTPLDLQPLTLEFLRRSMRLVVTRGTGRRLNDIPGMKIYAKTSTAQTSDLAKRKISAEYLEHAWFASYVQYKSEKPLAILVLVENAGTSQVSSTIAKDLLLAYKQYIDS
jgi:penicillin-binding protein 2